MVVIDAKSFHIKELLKEKNSSPSDFSLKFRAPILQENCPTKILIPPENKSLVRAK